MKGWWQPRLPRGSNVIAKGIDRTVQLTLKREAVTAAFEEHRHGVNYGGFFRNSQDASPPPEKLPSHMAAGSVRVTVGRARALAAKDYFGTSDPYCEVYVGELRYKTKVKPKKLDPVWGETADFDVASPQEAVHVVIFDWNQFNAHVFMGEVIIPLSKLARPGDVVEDWYELLKPASIDAGVQGELQLKVEMLNVNGHGAWNPSLCPPIIEMRSETVTSLAEHRQGKSHGLFGSGKVDKIVQPSGPNVRPLGKLRVTVVEAQHLTAMDAPAVTGQSGSSDPYADVFLEESYFRTSTIEQTTNPKWDDGEKLIPFTSFDSVLHVLLFNHDNFSNDDYLGEVMLPMYALRNYERQELVKWFKVQGPPNHTAPITGHVQLALQLVELDVSNPQVKEATRDENASAGRATPGKKKGVGKKKTAAGGSLASPGLSTRGSNVIAKGTFWRPSRLTVGYDPAVLALRWDLSSTAAAAGIEARMGEYRKQGRSKVIQVFSSGAPEEEKIEKVPREQERFKVTVKVIRGNDLLSADDNGFSDPYVEAHVWSLPAAASQRQPVASNDVHHMWRTKTQFETLNPSWEQDKDWSAAPLPSRDAVLHLMCFDWDRTGTDDFLGECLIDLARYADGQKHELTCVLDRYDTSSSGDAVTGELVIEVQLHEERLRTSRLSR